MRNLMIQLNRFFLTNAEVKKNATTDIDSNENDDDEQ